MRKRFKPWWQQDKRYQALTQAVLLALLPLLCCFVRCALDGETISAVWLPAGEWTEELFYYKQVESIISNGFVKGYSCFHESPVLVFPWVIWGLVFGWDFWSPIICNIFLMSAACFLFVWLVKPAWKQLCVLALLFALYTPFTRYMLSGMAEVICFGMVILFYALALNYLDHRKVFKLVLMFLLAAVMTLMRPYLLLFLLFPSYLWIRRDGWRGAFGSAAVLGAAVGIYAAIRHYLGAGCLFADASYGAGIWSRLPLMAKSFFGSMVQGFRTGLPAGAHFGGCAAILCILAGQSILDWRRFRALGRASSDSVVRDEENVAARRWLHNRLVIQVYLALCLVAMFFTVLLKCQPEEGSRHLLTFMAAGIFIIALMDTKFLIKPVLSGCILAYLYIYMARDPLYYALPYRQEERAEQFSEWAEILDARLVPDKGSADPEYEDSVIWVFQDEASDGSVKPVRWQLLYALPKGFGIRCCTPESILENMDGLKSRYIATLSGGRIDGMCRDAGYWEIGRDSELVIYRLH